MRLLKKRWVRISAVVVLIVSLLFAGTLGVVYFKQESIVQELLSRANKDFRGELVLGGSHISAFSNFPYVSIDLESLQVFESKNIDGTPLLFMEDVYIGLDILTVLGGDFQIKAIKCKDGYIHLVQHEDGSLNLMQALSAIEPIESPSEEFHLDLKSITAENLHLTKLNEESAELFNVEMGRAQARFKSNASGYEIGFDSDLILTVIKGEDTTFIRNKHIKLKSSMGFDNSTQKVELSESTIYLENAEFAIDGSIDMDDDANLQLSFSGSKRDFDLLLAFAPEELGPTLERYSNEGDIYFRATVEGPCVNGHSPAFRAEFGCKDGFFDNTKTRKRLDDLQFSGSFSTTADEGPSAMEFRLNSFSARPEAGLFTGALVVSNFDSPEINLQLDSDFDLDFLAKFFNYEDLKALSGHVLLKMNFHDIIDLSRPETSIERLNESYLTVLEVTDLSFQSPDFHLPIEDVDIKIHMDGHEAEIDYIRFKSGNTDLELSGFVDDLPAIIHHTSIPVNAKLKLKSQVMDLMELSSGDSMQSPINEVLTDLDLELGFKASAKAFTEFENLPIGEFLIDRLNVSFKNYPHRLHGFKADVFIEEDDFSVIDFSGLVDDSDFHFSGRLGNYNLWFEESAQGDTRIEFDLDSKRIRLEDLFSYGGENFVPEDYRHEVFEQLRVKGYSELHFKDSLYAADIYLNDLSGRMKMHQMKLEKFSGRFHFEDQKLEVSDFKARLGQSSFTADLQVDLKTVEEGNTHSNKLDLRATNLNFNELFAWNETEAETGSGASHDSVFSVFDLPFPNLDIELAIERMSYHQYEVSDFAGKFRTTKDHMLFMDELGMDIAGGRVEGEGYFSGEDRSNIYLDPSIRFEDLDIDQLLIKFDNFGQDAIVAENLHGLVTGELTGKIHLHADLVPIIEDSEIHLDLEVQKGRLDNYEPMLALADYFQDRNLNRVVFDTLKNHIDVSNGIVSIPNMRINSSLGFLELSGSQDLEMNMDYVIRVPFKMITSAGSQKLFGKKEDVDPETEDEIQYEEDGKRTRFVNVRMVGNPEDFKISLVGKKKVNQASPK